MSANATLNRSTTITLVLASALTATWLWSCWCSFPSIPWNDIRVAPAVALHHGISIYSLPASGPVSTWIYGPVPLLLLWPAGLAPSAIGAIEAAGAIHIALRVLSLVLVGLCWPAATPAPWRARLAAALICVLLVRNESSGYVVFTADSPGLVFGLCSLLALARQRPWLAAACAVAAAACKQTLLAVAVAQVIWLWAAVSPGAAARQAGRCGVAGLALALAAVAGFGFAGLWHTMVELPGRFPLVPIADRLQQHAWHLLFQVGLPLVALAAGYRYFFRRDSPLLLPAIAFLCALPLGLLGLLKAGGNVNSLHAFWLWFPPALAVVIASPALARWGEARHLALALAAAALASAWLQTSTLRMRPNEQAYRDAAALTARLPGQVWFPLHPVVTLYSDGRFYHDFDGLLERELAGGRLGDAQYWSGMPSRRRVVATLLPVGWGPADTAEARLPPNGTVHVYGQWRLDVAPD